METFLVPDTVGTRYTLFAIEPQQDGATSVLRVPVELKQGETKSLQLSFPTESGGTWLVP
ncbi:hypothetical protein [Corallococcus sp. EGB]|uniref:hypothetical protein n=1 Tax=Corallococcus sp. EGB TaxID=1521117 RepID=UPI001CBC7ADA|nr:hypothetical protein [Corallococcus sp. EGB]